MHGLFSLFFLKIFFCGSPCSPLVVPCGCRSLMLDLPPTYDRVPPSIFTLHSSRAAVCADATRAAVRNDHAHRCANKQPCAARWGDRPPSGSSSRLAYRCVGCLGRERAEGRARTMIGAGNAALFSFVPARCKQLSCPPAAPTPHTHTLTHAHTHTRTRRGARSCLVASSAVLSLTRH